MLIELVAEVFNAAVIPLTVTADTFAIWISIASLRGRRW